MKPLPLAVFAIVVWTLLIIMDNLPAPPPKKVQTPEPPVLTATNIPAQPSLQMTEQPQYRQHP